MVERFLASERLDAVAVDSCGKATPTCWYHRHWYGKVTYQPVRDLMQQ
jgi:hypothetical protein